MTKFGEVVWGESKTDVPAIDLGGLSQTRRTSLSSTAIR
jgi:hypothetical protein